MKNSNDSGINRRFFLKIVGWGSFFATLGISAIASIRFFSPRVLFEPPTTFRIGKPDDFNVEAGVKPAVMENWKKEHGVWVIKEKFRIYAIHAKCTHLGCTPNWFADDNVFKCPCHGSQFKSNGVNFAGPAPRPLDRLNISLNDEGEIYIDKSRIYKYKEFDKKGAYLKI